MVNIKVDDSAPIEVACRTLREYLGRERHLYSDGEVVVDVGKRVLFHDQQERIRKVIASESGLRIKQFWCEPEILEWERERIDGLIRAQTAITDRLNGNIGDGTQGLTQPTEEEAPPAESDAEGDSHYLAAAIVAGSERCSVPAEVIRGTCRAGEVRKFPGNVVVVGNVNPGAQIIAQGDILIFGKLRGLAHAGAGGDVTAVILAMSSVGPQLRIADYFWDADTPRAAAGRRGNDSDGPVIAQVRNRSVHISPYMKNYSIDRGGNPNER